MMWAYRIAMAFAACLVGGASEAQVQPSTPQGIRFAPSPEASSRWAPNRMEQAKPLPLRKADPAQVRSAIASQQRDGRIPAPPGRVDGFLQAGIKPFSANVNTMPLAYAGRLFFTTPQGDSTCSAQFIAPRLLLTAAHCVQDDRSGQWFQGFVFALQYERGRYLRRYDALCTAALTGWVGPAPANHQFDYAILMLNADSTVGHFGAMWNWTGRYNSGTKIGYPGGVENGEIIQVNHGPLALDQGLVAIRHGISADQRGSSGGAWLGGFSGTFSQQSNIVLSVTSFGYDDEPGVAYGPYFTEAFKSLYDFAGRGCR